MIEIAVMVIQYAYQAAFATLELVLLATLIAALAATVYRLIKGA